MVKAGRVHFRLPLAWRLTRNSWIANTGERHRASRGGQMKIER